MLGLARLHQGNGFHFVAWEYDNRSVMPTLPSPTRPNSETSWFASNTDARGGYGPDRRGRRRLTITASSC